MLTLCLSIYAFHNFCPLSSGSSVTLTTSMIVQLQLQPAYKVITLVGMLLCLLAIRATGISSTIHVDRDDNFVSLTCRDDLNVGPVDATLFYLDSESGPKSLGSPAIYHNFTLNKTNEGRYICKTTTNNAVTSTFETLIRKYHN